MISFNFSISNPWSHRAFKTIWSKFKPFKHKNLYVEIYKSDILISVDLYIGMRRDHSGITGAIGLFGHTLSIEFVDSRHWNEVDGCYEHDA